MKPSLIYSLKVWLTGLILGPFAVRLLFFVLFPVLGTYTLEGLYYDLDIVIVNLMALSPFFFLFYLLVRFLKRRDTNKGRLRLYASIYVFVLLILSCIILWMFIPYLLIYGLLLIVSIWRYNPESIDEDIDNTMDIAI